MEIKEDWKWDPKCTQELYYDKVFNFFIIKFNQSIFIKYHSESIFLSISLDKACEDICCQILTHLRINIKRKLLCCLTSSDTLHLIRYKGFKTYSIKLKKEKTLGFSFISNSDIKCIFFIVTTSRLMLYKINEKNSKIELLKALPAEIMEYSFEENEGIIAVITTTGKVLFYFLYQSKDSFQGQTLNLFASQFEYRLVFSSPKSQDLLKFTPRIDCNQASLYKIYNEVYLIHLDNQSGKLFLYSVFPNDPVLYATFTVNQGIFSLGISENLIILLNFTIQSTFIYDIQSHMTEYLVKINHLDQDHDPSRQRISAEISTKTELNCDSFFLLDSTIIDVSNFALQTVKINPADLIENHPDDQKIILFLLRRENTKQKVLDKLRQTLLVYTEIKKLEKIFCTLAAAYALAELENPSAKKAKRFTNVFQHLELTTSRIDPNHELKVKEGVTVITQSDIYYFIFDPVYKSSFNYSYLSMALYSFFSYFIQAGLKVHYSIQFLFVKVLLKTQDLAKLQSLIEGRCLKDSQDIALLLIGFSKTNPKFPIFFMFGIDMLKRLKLFNLIAQELASQDFIYEGLDILQIFPLDKQISEDLFIKFNAN